jgi:hypothetical protein
MLRSRLASLLALFALTTVLPGQQSPAKPKMEAPTSMTLHIDQSDPQIKLARTQVYGDQSFKWDLDIVADGQKEVVQSSPQYTANIKAYWQGDSLVLDQKITASDGTKATDVVTYSLSPDSRTLQAVEQQTTAGVKKSLTSKWVYDKQAQ